MNNYMEVLQNRNIKVGGIVLGVVALVGAGCLIYKVIKKLTKPRYVCFNCVSDDDLDMFFEQSNDFDDDFDEYENLEG